MDFFLDSTDLEEIRRLNNLGIIDYSLLLGVHEVQIDDLNEFHFVIKSLNLEY